MERKVKISIIIPVYNAEGYLQKCLDSIARQTLQEYEVILVNDGSTDGSLGVMEAFASEQDGRVKILNKENARQAAARNDGLKLAVGEYVAFADSDDYMEPDYLQTLYEAAVEQDSDCVICGYSMVSDKGEVIRHVKLCQDKVVPYGRAGMFVVWCRLLRRSFLEEHQFSFQEGGKIYEDVPYAIATKFMGRNPVAIGYEGYAYVQHVGSTMSSGTVSSEKFPFEKMTQSIEQSLRYIEDNRDCLTREEQADKRDRLEFEVLHFFAGFFFRYCRKANKREIGILVEYAQKVIREHFPRYYRNPYVGIFCNKEQPFVDRAAVRMLVWTNRIGCLGMFAKLVTRV